LLQITDQKDRQAQMEREQRGRAALADIVRKTQDEIAVATTPEEKDRARARGVAAIQPIYTALTGKLATHEQMVGAGIAQTTGQEKRGFEQQDVKRLQDLVTQASTPPVPFGVQEGLDLPVPPPQSEGDFSLGIDPSASRVTSSGLGVPAGAGKLPIIQPSRLADILSLAGPQAAGPLAEQFERRGQYPVSKTAYDLAQAKELRTGIESEPGRGFIDTSIGKEGAKVTRTSPTSFEQTQTLDVNQAPLDETGRTQVIESMRRDPKALSDDLNALEGRIQSLRTQLEGGVGIGGAISAALAGDKRLPVIADLIASTTRAQDLENRIAVQERRKPRSINPSFQVSKDELREARNAFIVSHKREPNDREWALEAARLLYPGSKLQEPK